VRHPSAVGVHGTHCAPSTREGRPRHPSAGRPSYDSYDDAVLRGGQPSARAGSRSPVVSCGWCRSLGWPRIGSSTLTPLALHRCFGASTPSLAQTSLSHAVPRFKASDLPSVFIFCFVCVFV
jgi:hypothetical protein